MKSLLIAFLSAICIVFVFLFVFGGFKVDKLYADFLLFQRAQNFEGVGRNCSVLNYDDLKRIMPSKYIGQISDKTGVVNLSSSQRCVKNAKLIRTTYYADYQATSNVYRCTKDNLIEELQLTVRMNPNIPSQRHDCKFAELKKEWDIPIGEATMFVPN